MGATFTQLKVRAQERVDMEGGTGPVSSDTEWLSLLNAGYRELWDVAATAFGDHFITSANFTLTGGASGSDYTLPADFERLRGLDYQVSTGRYQDVPAFSFSERNRLYERCYRLMGAVLQVRDTDLAAGTYRIWYVPGPTLLDVANTVQVDARVDAWNELIVLAAAIKALAKEDSDTAIHEREKADIIRRVQTSARRDSSRPPVVSDVTADDVGFVGGRMMWDP